MDTIKSVVAAGRDRERVAIDGPSRPAPYRYPDFCTDVWKAGNLYSHYGVQNGGTVAVVPRGHPTADVDTRDHQTRDGSPPRTAIPMLGILGGAVVGSRVRVPNANPVDAGVVLAHVEDLPDVDTVGQSTLLAYGGDSERAAVERFESGLWSENPVEPPETVTPEDGFLVRDGDDLTQGELVRAAAAVADAYGVDGSASVILEAPLTDVRAVLAGLLMPLFVGATIHLGADSDANAGVGEDRQTADQSHDFVVAREDSATGLEQLISTGEAERFLKEA